MEHAKNVLPKNSYQLTFFYTKYLNKTHFRFTTVGEIPICAKYLHPSCAIFTGKF